MTFRHYFFAMAFTILVMVFFATLFIGFKLNVAPFVYVCLTASGYYIGINLSTFLPDYK